MYNSKKYMKRFKYSLTFFVSLFIVTLTLALYSATKLDFCYEVKCINFFFSDVLKTPLSVIVFGIPICGVFLALNKSHQTEIQIKQTSDHNIANNYYMHKKEFDSLCKSLEQELPIKIDTYTLYRFLFPKNSPYFIEYKSTESDLDLLKAISPLLDSIGERHTNFATLSLNEFYHFMMEIGSFMMKTGIKGDSKNNFALKFNSENIIEITERFSSEFSKEKLVKIKDSVSNGSSYNLHLFNFPNEHIDEAFEVLITFSKRMGAFCNIPIIEEDINTMQIVYNFNMYSEDSKNVEAYQDYYSYLYNDKGADTNEEL